MCSLKKCPKCGIEKPLTSEFFRVESRRINGFESRCKECQMSEKTKARIAESESGLRTCNACHIEKPLSEFNKQRYDNYGKGKLTTRGMCRDCHNDRMSFNRIKNKTENYEYHTIREKLNSAKKRAKQNGYSFDITIEDLMPFPSHCEILGLELSYQVFGESRPENGASLDKIIPDLGYIKGNVKIISAKANRLKSDLDLDTIEKIKSYIIRNL